MSHASATSLSLRGAAAVAAVLALASGNAQAQTNQRQPSPSPVAQGLFNDPEAEQARRYSTPDGAVRFVLDRSTGGRVALVRFEGDPEVHVLRPAMASGGDELYRTEDGDIVLRLTRHGGITVYTRNNRTGSPASEGEQVPRLAPDAVARAVFEARLRELQQRAARSVGGPVTFVPPPQLSNVNAGIVLDAAERATQGLSEAPMTSVRRVVITFGRAPGAQLRGDALTIQVAPEMGYAGRPSSTTIRNVATGSVQGPNQ